METDDETTQLQETKSSQHQLSEVIEALRHLEDDIKGLKASNDKTDVAIAPPISIKNINDRLEKMEYNQKKDLKKIHDIENVCRRKERNNRCVRFLIVEILIGLAISNFRQSHIADASLLFTCASWIYLPLRIKAKLYGLSGFYEFCRGCLKGTLEIFFDEEEVEGVKDNIIITGYRLFIFFFFAAMIPLIVDEELSPYNNKLYKSWFHYIIGITAILDIVISSFLLVRSNKKINEYISGKQL